MMWLFLLCSLAIAEEPAEQVVTVQQGETVPFDGTLLNPTAVSRLLANQQESLSTCLANAQRDLDVQAANLNFEIKTKENDLALCTLEMNRSQEMYLERIEWLEKRTSPPSWQGPVLFGSGVVAGIAVVVLSAYTLDKIQEN